MRRSDNRSAISAEYRGIRPWGIIDWFRWRDQLAIIDTGLFLGLVCIVIPFAILIRLVRPKRQTLRPTDLGNRRRYQARRSPAPQTKRNDPRQIVQWPAALL